MSATERTTVWVLNLDAEIELSRNGNYATPKSLAPLIATKAQQFAALLPASARILRDDAPLPLAAGVALGACWCPTPSALQRLRRAGVEVPLAPARAVLTRANDRGFCAELGQMLPGAAFLADALEVKRLLQSQSPTGVWLCKRAFGFAGRGQRRMQGPLSIADERWIQDALVRGGIQVEPLVSIHTEFSLHGFVFPDGRQVSGQLCQQTVDAERAWAGTTLVPTGSAPEIESALCTELNRVALALYRMQYFGPFAIDAFLWHEQGRLRLNVRSEINARFTMGYPIGMGERLGECLLPLG